MAFTKLLLFLKVNDREVWHDINKSITEIQGRRKTFIKTIIWNPACCYNAWMVSEYCPEIKYIYEKTPFYCLTFSTDVMEGGRVLPFK